jgi:hypothetical protein
MQLTNLQIIGKGSVGQPYAIDDRQSDDPLNNQSAVQAF